MQPSIRPTVPVVAALLVVLAACGGKGGDTGGPPETARPTPPTTTMPATGPGVPAQTPAEAGQAPVVAIADTLHVGADVAPKSALSHRTTHGAATVSHGQVRDSVGREAVEEYLTSQELGLPIYPGQPDPNIDPNRQLSMVTYPGTQTIRLSPTATRDLTGTVITAIQLVNAALPPNAKLAFSTEPAPAWGEREGLNPGDIPIHVRELPEGHAGQADIFHARDGRLAASYIRIAPEPIAAVAQAKTIAERRRAEHALLTTVTHELLHAIGIVGHPDPQVVGEALMTGTSAGNPSHILFPVDREVLLASHTVIRPVASAREIHEDLGAWNETSMHIRGNLATGGGPVDFGVAVRNGFLQPWASGSEPATTLAANRALEGEATWNGRLIGFTPGAEAVAGAARLGIELSTLDGSLAFTNLEHWPAMSAPGAVGTGTRWEDGDLAYDVRVRGNTFVQASGDEGTVTGAFFGDAHQGMGGALERTDLVASFGGKR